MTRAQHVTMNTACVPNFQASKHFPVGVFERTLVYPTESNRSGQKNPRVELKVEIRKDGARWAHAYAGDSEGVLHEGGGGFGPAACRRA